MERVGVLGPTQWVAVACKGVNAWCIGTFSRFAEHGKSRRGKNGVELIGCSSSGPLAAAAKSSQGSLISAAISGCLRHGTCKIIFRGAGSRSQFEFLCHEHNSRKCSRWRVMVRSPLGYNVGMARPSSVTRRLAIVWYRHKRTIILLAAALKVTGIGSKALMIALLRISRRNVSCHL